MGSEMMDREYISKEQAKRFWPMQAEPLPLSEGIDPPANLPERVVINVNGREEHEAVIKDGARCKELGIDQLYETMVYLNRWGGWLNADNTKSNA